MTTNKQKNLKEKKKLIQGNQCIIWLNVTNFDPKRIGIGLNFETHKRQNWTVPNRPTDPPCWVNSTSNFYCRIEILSAKNNIMLNFDIKLIRPVLHLYFHVVSKTLRDISSLICLICIPWSFMEKGSDCGGITIPPVCHTLIGRLFST
jgi:hypothetical protein